jgi:hypothetical protein
MDPSDDFHLEILPIWSCKCQFIDPKEDNSYCSHNLVKTEVIDELYCYLPFHAILTFKVYKLYNASWYLFIYLFLV